MAIKVNGKDMKDAVIKTEQYDMQILDLTPDYLKVTVKDNYGEAFNFVPRFISMAYPDKTINAKDAGIVIVGTGETKEVTISFQEKLRIEKAMTMRLQYARRKIADIAIE